MNVWGITDRGKIREQNQDAFAHQVLPDGRVIALVCDGMGGARAGNIASSMAVDVFMEAFLEDGEDSPDLEHMERAAALANRQVFRRAVEDENCVGMGTTLVGVMAQLTGRSNAGIAAIAVLFVIGFILFVRAAKETQNC